MRPYATTNPVTGERVREYPPLPDSEVDGVVERAHYAFASWRLVALEERSAILRRSAMIHRERAQEPPQSSLENRETDHPALGEWLS